MDVRWLTVFIDQPSDVFERGTRYWRDVTGSGLSPPRGESEQFATLLPADGDPYIRVQRLDDGTPRVHLDLHVHDVGAAAERAVDLGAVHRHDGGDVAVLASPAGFVFCFVADDGSSVVPRPSTEPRPHRLDQVCVDIPAGGFDAEVTFWAELTGWDPHVGVVDEFVFFSQPADLPLRLLLQRLGTDDEHATAGAHLDLACGDHRAEVAGTHRVLGADPVAVFTHWTVMRDPIGLPYCLTGRDPTTGRLAT